MLSNTPIESVHTLPLDSLRKPEVTFWSVWYQEELSGCGALMELDGTHGEIKSMRTKAKFLAVRLQIKHKEIYADCPLTFEERQRQARH